MKTLRNGTLLLEFLTRRLVIALMLFMVGTVLLDVLARNTALRVRGLDEIARFTLVWIVFLVTAIGARYGDLIGMDSLANILPRKLGSIVWVIRRLLFFTFLVLFGWYALGLIEMMWQTGRATPNLRIPLWFVYAPLFVGTSIMFVSLVADFSIRFTTGDFDTKSEMQRG